MRNPNRIPLMLEVIRQAWEKAPDLRLGQLIVNTRVRGDDHLSIQELYNREDDQMMEELLRLYGS